MAARSESVRFDITANDRASAAFSAFGRAVNDAGDKMATATAKSDFLDDALKRQAVTARRSTDATLALAKSDDILKEVQTRLAKGALEAEFALKKETRAKLEDAAASRAAAAENRKLADSRHGLFSRIPGIGGLFGGGAGAGGAGSAGQAASGAGGMLTNPYVLGGIAAAATASAPFIGQVIGGSIISVLGAGLVGLGIAGSMMTGKAPTKVTALQLTAAQDRLAAAQAAQAALGRKATPAQIASAAGSVASAQGSLSTLQTQAALSAQFQAENRLQLQTKAAFASLSDSAKDSLAKIGVSFVPVMKHIFDTAHDVLNDLTPVFAGAVKTISGPFSEFAGVLLRTFTRPDVKKSIQDVANAFGAILVAVTPALGSTMGNIAIGISKIAQSISANPQIFANFVQFFGQVIGGALTAIAWLTRVASYIEAHFAPAMHRVAVIFDGVRHDIAHIWDQIWNNSVGIVIRLGHDVERDFNDFRHRTAVVFDGIRGDIAHYWDMTFNNTIGRIQRGFHDIAHWFDVGRAAIAAGFKNAVTWLAGVGSNIITGLWNGLKSIWASVANWFKSLPGAILHALGINSPPQWAIDAGKHIMTGLFGWTDTKKHQLLTKFSTLGASVGAAAAGAVGGAPGQVQALARTMAAARGWTGLQWDALNAVEMREAGWQLGARNPTSGAYGIAQFINGPGEYYQFGGNPNTAAGQITGMLNYIAQRYANPLIALGHEQRFGWYDQGGFLPPGLSLAYNTTGRPEPVGAARGGGDTYIINVGPGVVNGAEVGRQIAGYLRQHEKRSGKGWRTP